MNKYDSYNLIAELAHDHTDGKVIFDEAVKVMKSQHHLLFTAFGVWASPNNTVFLLAGDGVWHELHPDQANAEYLIKELLELMKHSNELNNVY